MAAKRSKAKTESSRPRRPRTKTIRFLQGISGQSYSYAPKQVVSLPVRTANRFIKSGHAEALPSEEEAAKIISDLNQELKDHATASAARIRDLEDQLDQATKLIAELQPKGDGAE